MTDQEIEIERKRIIKETVTKMIAENVVIANPTVSARLEKDFPGFQFSVKAGDRWRDAIDDSLPPDTVAPTVGALAVLGPTVGALAVVEPSDVVTPVTVEGHEPEPMDVEALRERIHAGEL
jgi:hypothetical protein